MSIFRKLQNDFPLYLGKFIVLLKENFSFAGCKPVHAYSDAEIDLTPNPRLYIGLSEDERLEKIKQNLAYVWADGYESKKWESRKFQCTKIRLLFSSNSHPRPCSRNGSSEFFQQPAHKPSETRITCVDATEFLSEYISATCTHSQNLG
ncbi:MAG: hypothetical protein MSS98_04390 [Alphaproteobacteria bacterium]|nr:hypothetical protein [Alphaproteobacteria bacterium]MDY4690388.1 hypothetical protein [Alphaproteobacteria bacterium]